MDITNLSQTAQQDDRLMPQWVNAARDAIASLTQQIAYANEQISTLKSQLSQAFQVVPTAGLTATVAAGNAKLPNGLIVAIAQTTITVFNNAISIVYISDTGQIRVSLERPSVGLELARVTASGGVITAVQNYPIFEVRPAAINLENYATVEYANSRNWQQVAIARKTTTFPISSKDTYHRLTWEELSGTGWNTGGTFTAPVAGKYVFHPQVRIDSTTPLSSPDLSGKMSLFLGNDEYNTALQQGESARADLVLNATNAEPAQMKQGDTASIRVYITIGSSCRVREKSICQVWRINN